MEDDFEFADATEATVFGAVAWLVVPYVIGRLIEANVSVTAGDWAGPAVASAMLVWAAFNPARSRAKIALLLAIDLAFSIGVVISVVGFVIAVIVAGFELHAVYRLAWFLPAAAAALGAAKFVVRWWIRRDLRRCRLADAG